ncbi:MAG: DUF3108 domain-containing protein [Burkholderiales bacterium]
MNSDHKRAHTLRDFGSITARRLAAALAISVALHLCIGSWIRAPKPRAPPEPIHATLIVAKESAQTASELPKAEPDPVRAAMPAPRQRKAPKPPPSPLVSTPMLREAQPESQPDADPTTSAGLEDAPASTASKEVVPGPQVPAAAEPVPIAAQLPPAAAPLRAERSILPQGTIRYDLFYGSNRFLVGRSELTWDIADGRYRLATSGKTIGLAALFYPFGMSSGSEGRVTESGFQPDLFFVDRTSRKGEKQFRVSFDWEAGIARFSGAEGDREAPLRPASLDLLSLICQLSVLKLEPGPMQLNLTNGRKLDTYEVQVGRQEVVETPLGELRAVYVKQLRKPGDEGIEVWLGVDFGYLPVRLRFTDRKGGIAGEQLVTDIRLVRG